jgi:hypothetical protein
VDTLELALAHDRADVGSGVEAVAELEPAHPRVELIGELAEDRLVHDDAAGCRAALAGGPESAPDDPVQGEPEVRVIHHDDGVLPTHFQRNALAQSRTLDGDLLADLIGPGEGDERDVRVLDERGPHRLAGSEDEVEHAGRQTGFLEDLDESDSRARCVASGLEDDRVPADQRRHDLPGRYGDREVPRRDEPDHADRSTLRHVPLVGELGRSRLAPEAATLTRHVEGHVDRFLDVASGLGKNLAHLLGHLAR